MALLQYKHTHELHPLKASPIRCIAFSPSGGLIAFGTTRVEIWQTLNGQRHRFVESIDNSNAGDVDCMAWTDEHTLHFGDAAGRLVTVTLDDKKQELRISIMKASDSPIKFISFHKSACQLAVAGSDVIRVWFRQTTRETDQWQDRGRLSNPPAISAAESRPVRVAFIGWRGENILVAYRHHGSFEWAADTTEQRPNQVLPTHDIIHHADYSSDGDVFAISNGSGIDVYGFSPTPSLLGSFTSKVDQKKYEYPFQLVHGGHAILEGGHEAVLWQIDTKLELQVLETNCGASMYIASSGGHYNETTDTFQIASSSGSTLQLWKAITFPDIRPPPLLSEGETPNMVFSGSMMAMVIAVMVLAVLIMVSTGDVHVFAIL
ncbi:hypothetical protein HGRIS_000856 [Hohenbuehelia grisea]|uniref:WD40 repeat-like protein n=1 Tax=Hohenbuehelia grisea TaxID=104357 RepID=A0ABR3IPY4_9AGAR